MTRRWHFICFLALSFCAQKTKQAPLTEPQQIAASLMVPAEIPQDDPKSPAVEILEAAAPDERRQLNDLVEEMRRICQSGENQEDPMGVALCNVLLNAPASEIVTPALTAIPVALENLKEAEEKVAEAAREDATVCEQEQNRWAQACQPETLASMIGSTSEEGLEEKTGEEQHETSHKLTRGQYFTALILGVVAVSIKEEFDSIWELGKAHYNMHTMAASESKVKYLKVQKWAGIGAMALIAYVLLSGGAEHLIHIAHNPTSDDWRNLSIGFAAAATFSYVVGYYAYHNYYFEAAERGWVTKGGDDLAKIDNLKWYQSVPTSFNSMIRSGGTLLGGNSPLQPRASGTGTGASGVSSTMDKTGHELEHAVKGEFKVGTMQYVIAAAFFGISMYVAREEKKKKEGEGLHLAGQPTLSEALLPTYSRFISIGQTFHRENVQGNPFKPLDVP